MSRQLLTFGGQFMRARGNPLAAYAAGGIEPATVLDFALDKYLGTVSAFSDLTFARASNATYVDANGLLQTAAANEPRFDYTDGIRHLLIELIGATNLLTYSSDPSNAAWSNSGITVGSETDGGVAGSYYPLTVPGTAAAGIYQIFKPTSSGQNYCSYIIAKAATGDPWVTATVYDTVAGDRRAWFNLSTGAKGSADAGVVDYDIVDLGSGWYLCWCVAAAASTSGGAVYHVCNSDAQTTAADAGDVVLFAGAQFEAGSVPSSYIPTAGATATRAAETITFDLDAGTYDVRVVTDEGTTDLTSVVHGGGAYWPTEANGRVAQVIVYPEGALA